MTAHLLAASLAVVPFQRDGYNCAAAKVAVSSWFMQRYSEFLRKKSVCFNGNLSTTDRAK
jgi:hypothetical protein